MSEKETKMKCSAALYNISMKLQDISEQLASDMCLFIAKHLSDSIEIDISEEIQEIVEEIKKDE